MAKSQSRWPLSGQLAISLRLYLPEAACRWLGTVWGRQLVTSMLADAGFGDVQVREVESEPLNYYYSARR
jgi:hypothetical protein